MKSQTWRQIKNSIKNEIRQKNEENFVKSDKKSKKTLRV
jgi:hypothetical protein